MFMLSWKIQRHWRLRLATMKIKIKGQRLPIVRLITQGDNSVDGEDRGKCEKCGKHSKVKKKQRMSNT